MTTPWRHYDNVAEFIAAIKEDRQLDWLRNRDIVAEEMRRRARKGRR